MIKKHIESMLTENLQFAPTSSQLNLIRGLSGFIQSDEPDRIMLIRGYAGTGKTTVIRALTQSLQSLRIRYVLMAPTGRAAKVMSVYTGMPAFTIHKKIFRQKSSSDMMGKFVLNVNLYKNTWFIVDEASMIANDTVENAVFGSGRLLDDLLEFVYSGENCRLVLVGDVAQLPPVGVPVSPALDRSVLESAGFGVLEYELSEVVRQAEDSGILYNATGIRKKIMAGEEKPGFFHLDIDRFPDLECISGGELIEAITSCYEKYGLFETTIVTRSNKRANLYNKGIRGSVLYRENEIERGDLLMVVRNNYFWSNEGMEFIANGDIAEIGSISGYESLYGFRFAKVTLRFVDHNDAEVDCMIFLDTLTIETASFGQEQNRQLFEAVSEDYADIGNKRNRWKKVKENPYFNALQVKYAYALTCHKAQGGQWRAVFVDHGYLTEEMLDTEYYRWLYTAFTRPVEKLFLVNFNKGFLE